MPDIALLFWGKALLHDYTAKAGTLPGCVTERQSLKHRIELLTKVIKVYTLLCALASINVSTKCFFIKTWHVTMKTFQVAYSILLQACLSTDRQRAQFWNTLNLKENFNI